jgi:hypothetical protein
VGKPEGKRSLGRLRCKWDDNIKMDHSLDWIDLIQDGDH